MRAFRSRRPHSAATVETCSGVVTFGIVITKKGGRAPRVRPARVVTKTSSVRRLRPNSSPESGLMRIPMKGGREPPAIPPATSSAVRRAWPSSSASGRLP